MSAVYDALLLLGVELDVQDAPTEEMRQRVAAAVRCYERGESKLIVLCGGVLPRHRKSEASVMAELLAAQGVPREAMLLDENSQDTMGNFKEAAALLGGAKGKCVLVVTSDYHLMRAVMTAKRVGFRAQGESAGPIIAAGADKAEGDKALYKKLKKEQRRLKCMEACFILDLLMGWQDKGKSRPAWLKGLFNGVFGADK